MVRPDVIQEAGHLVHELIQGFRAMVTGDVSVQIAPEPLNGVMLRAVRGQEVQLNFPLLSSESCLSYLAGMNDVVVDNQVEDLIDLELLTKFLH
jgi:hypothetical protein